MVTELRQSIGHKPCSTPAAPAWPGRCPRTGEQDSHESAAAQERIPKRRSLAIATTDGEGAWFNPAELDPPDEQAFAAWISDPARPKALHDAKGPSLAFAARGWTLQGVTSDTALSAYLARPDQRSYDLADLALRYLKRELRAEDKD